MRKHYSILVVLTMVLFLPMVRSQESICAKVKIEILQELTLEREAFEARMAIHNGLAGVALENIQVNVNFTDRNNASILATSDANNLNAKILLVDTWGSSVRTSEN